MTCYRHPNRETGRQCTRCGKPACSDCLVAASIGSQCLDCVRAAQPDLKTRANHWKARQMAPATSVLIALNVLVFVWVALGGGDAVLFGGNDRTVDLGLNKLILVATEEWYRVVTSGFIHYGILHLAMNMYGLFILGGTLERQLGSVRFVLLYVASLLGGSAGIVLIQPNDFGIHGGASGAVFGLMAALAVSLWRQGVNPLNSSIGQLLMVNLLITFAGRNFISVGGHLGGAAIGALCAVVMLAKPWKPAPKWATYATPIGIGAASIAVIVASVLSA
jgi:membrane associated rhomboid family serine protease